MDQDQDLILKIEEMQKILKSQIWQVSKYLSQDLDKEGAGNLEWERFS